MFFLLAVENHVNYDSPFFPNGFYPLQDSGRMFSYLQPSCIWNDLPCLALFVAVWATALESESNNTATFLISSMSVPAKANAFFIFRHKRCDEWALEVKIKPFILA